MMNAISSRCRASTDATIELSDSLLILLLVVPSPPSMLLPTTSSEISYTLAEFSNEFKNENQEHHDFCNVFNAQMQAVAKRNCIYQYYRKRIYKNSYLHPHTHI